MNYPLSDLRNDTVEVEVSSNTYSSTLLSLLGDISYHSKPHTYSDELGDPIQEEALYKGYTVRYTDDGRIFVTVYFDRNKSLPFQYRQLGRDMFRYAEKHFPYRNVEAKCQGSDVFERIGELGMCDCMAVGFMNKLPNRRLSFVGHCITDRKSYNQWALSMAEAKVM